MTTTNPIPRIDRDSRQPVHLQIADQLRAWIKNGTLHEGQKLPSIKSLASMARVTADQIYEAINLLGSQGWVYARHGYGTIVRTPPPPRQIDPSRYREEIRRLRSSDPDTEKSTAMLRDLHAQWDDLHVDVISTDRLPASPHQAELLGVDPGTEIMRRETVDHVAGKPIQIRRCVLRWDTIDGTFFADPEYTHRDGGTIAELDALGYAVDNGIEHLRGRPATRTECAHLLMSGPAQVFEYTRRFCAGDTPVEVSEVVMPQANATFEWTWQ